MFAAGDAYQVIAPDSATVLTDPTATFIANGVAAGDIVLNTTDGSSGIVASRTGQTITLVAPLTGNTDAVTPNVFAAGDAYQVIAPDSATVLTDPTATFIANGVAAGDIVLNTTDGSSGIVASRTGQTITLVAPLTGNTDAVTPNVFAAGDAYQVIAPDSATVLTDPTATFIANGVAAGDIVLNTTDGSSGIVASRTGQTITLVAPLAGGTDFDPNIFKAGDAYVVHAATATPSATVMNDATATFITDGVVAGDPVVNATDGSTGTVATVNSETRITLVAALTGGTANTFAVGDVYAVGEVAFDALPADGYLVHLDLASKTDENGDPVYKVTREEDINIGNGDTFVPQVPPPACAGPLHQVDVADFGTDGYGPVSLDDPSGNGGAPISAPASETTANPTFVDIGASPYEGTARPLCDTKLVDLQNGKSIVPMFNVFTDVPLPGRFFFYNVDDLNFSTDPKSILYGEKAGMAFNPVGVYDWANRLVTTVETDYNGLADVLLPSTNRINCPTPSGVCANLYRMVGNDPGVPGRLNLNYNPQYRTIAAEFEVFAGLIVPADTAPTQLGVNAQLPGAQFNGPLVCRVNDPAAPTAPELYAVSRPYVDMRTAGTKSFSIDGQGFGAAAGTVALDGVALPTTSWSASHIDVTVPATTPVGPHQLAITSTSGARTVNGITFHVLGQDVFPATAVLDDFNRSTASTAQGLGASWGADGNTTSRFRVTPTSLVGFTNQAQALTNSTSSQGNATWLPGTGFGPNQEAYFTFTKTATAAEQGVLLKFTGSSASPNANASSWISVVFNGTSNAVQVKTKNAGSSTITNRGPAIAATFAAGDQLGARAFADGTVRVFKNGAQIGAPVAIPTTGATAFVTGGGRIAVRFAGTTAANDARFDNFGGGTIGNSRYEPNLYEVGPGLSGPNQFPAVQYDEGNPPHPVQDALDAAAASPGDDLIVVYPGLATPSNPRLNPRGAYYENLIVHSPVKLQGVGPGSADGSVQGSVIDGSAFGGDTALADNWRTAIDALTRVGNQTVYEGPVVSVFAATTSQYGSAFRAGIDGFDVRGGDQSNFPTNINQIGGGPTGLPANAITQGGGVFVNAYARYLQITNNVIESNSGSYAGGIRIGTPNLPEPDTSQHNDHVRIANNRVVTNGGTNLAGGIGLFAGSDGYTVSGNDICGNSSAEYGGGVSVYGYSPNGSIDHNRIWFNSSYDEGAGIMIAGELPADPLILSPGTGPVDIRENLVQANIANDDGGGIRFLMAGNYPMNVVNNMIVNNVSTHEGGGIAIDDAPAVRVINNTVMNNITTATAATSTGEAAPAGLSTGANSDLLQATLPGGSPTFSEPLLFNNVFWDNRAGTRSGGTVVGIGLPGDATPIDTWDLGVSDGAGLLSPTNSILQSQGHAGVIASPTNVVDADPSVASEFDLSVSFSPWRTNPNFVGALLVAVDAPAGTLGDYHVPATSPAVDAGAASKSGVIAPAWDIDNDGRPNGGAIDIGADERAGVPAPAAVPAPLAFPQAGLLDAFNRANGALGNPWTGSTNQNNFRIDGSAVQVRLGGDVYRNATAFGANQEAYLTFTQVGPAAATKQGLILKRTGTGTTATTASLIEVVYNRGAGAVQVRTKASGGVLVDRASFPAVFYAGDQLGARALADGTITVFRNGIQVGSVSVPAGTWAGASGGGQVGVRIAGTGNPPGDARFDDFGGGTLP